MIKGYLNNKVSQNKVKILFWLRPGIFCGVYVKKWAIQNYSSLSAFFWLHKPILAFNFVDFCLKMAIFTGLVQSQFWRYTGFFGSCMFIDVYVIEKNLGASWTIKTSWQMSLIDFPGRKIIHALSRFCKTS